MLVSAKKTNLVVSQLVTQRACKAVAALGKSHMMQMDSTTENNSKTRHEQRRNSSTALEVASIHDGQSTSEAS